MIFWIDWKDIVASQPLDEVFSNHDSKVVAKQFREAYLKIDSIYSTDKQLPSLEQKEKEAFDQFPGLDSTQLRAKCGELSSEAPDGDGGKLYKTLLNLHRLRLDKNRGINCLWEWYGCPPMRELPFNDRSPPTQVILFTNDIDLHTYELISRSVSIRGLLSSALEPTKIII